MEETQRSASGQGLLVMLMPDGDRMWFIRLGVYSLCFELNHLAYTNRLYKAKQASKDTMYSSGLISDRNSQC